MVTPEPFDPDRPPSAGPRSSRMGGGPAAARDLSSAAAVDPADRVGRVDTTMAGPSRDPGGVDERDDDAKWRAAARAEIEEQRRLDEQERRRRAAADDRRQVAAPSGPVVVERHGDDIRVVPDEELAAQRAHRRFGGLDVPAALAGMLAGVGLAVILGGIVAGAGTVGYQLDVQRDEQVLSAGGFIVGLVVLLVSFLVGGWVSGRMARYDGGRNGLLAAVSFLVLTAVLAGIGAWLGQDYDVFSRVDMPRWFNDNSTTAAGVISAVVAIAVSLGAGFLGGLLGARYHRRVDHSLTDQEAARNELARRAVSAR